jgi:hypothetical protein
MHDVTQFCTHVLSESCVQSLSAAESPDGNDVNDIFAG